MKKLLIVLLALPFIGLGQDAEIDNSKSKKISFDTEGGIGLGFVQDRNSPTTYGKIGISNDFFKLHLVPSANYFFSTKNDNSREVYSEKYIGVEWLMPSPSWGNNSGNDKWDGIGFSYCFKKEEEHTELHKKNPVKAYVVRYFGVVSVTAEYVWSDIRYPAVTVRFGY